MGKDIQGGRFRAAVHGFDADDDLFGRILGVFDENIEVPILLKYARVEKFELRARARRRRFSSTSAS